MTSPAEIAASQIGRRAFVMMGAKNIVTDGSTLRFDVGSNAKGITAISIELDPSDTYTVRTFKGRPASTKLDMKTGEFVTRGGRKLVDAVSFVYAENLRTVIESATGLYLSL